MGRGRKKTIKTVDGQEIEATIMGYQTGAEHWNEYLLDDGSLIRIKLVTTEILRVDGHYDAEGNPLYVLNSTNVMTTTSPDELKGKEEE